MFRDTERKRNEIVKINVVKDIKEMKEKLDIIGPVVKCLQGRRNSYYAHADKAYIDNIPLLASDYPLSFKQIADLIQTANEILNTLLSDLCGEVVALNSLNYDDVRNIFEILKTLDQDRYREFLKSSVRNTDCVSRYRVEYIKKKIEENK